MSAPAELLTGVTTLHAGINTASISCRAKNKIDTGRANNQKLSEERRTLFLSAQLARWVDATKKEL